MTQKHTPGPWKKRGSNAVADNSGESVCMVYERCADEDTGATAMRDANIALICAAPDLLRGCQAAIAYLSTPASKFTANREEAERIILFAISAATRAEKQEERTED